MKKTFLLLITLLTGYVTNAQVVNIPDANFKARLLSSAVINSNGDMEIQVSEATAYTGTINCSNAGITDLTGIEAFVNATGLDCPNNQLTSVDLSANAAFTFVRLDNNELTSAHFGTSTNLTNINVRYNQLTTLDVSANTSLQFLTINDNAISSLILHSGPGSFRNINCANNQLTQLDLSAHWDLKYLTCSGNQLTELNVRTGTNTSFVSFDATNNPDLACIKVDNAAYSTSNWTNIDPTTSFDEVCDNCVITIPDANFKNYLLNQALINVNGDNEIQCSEAEGYTGTIVLTTVSVPGTVSDVTGIEAFTNITGFTCVGQNITALDLSNNVLVESASCHNNALTSLLLGNNSVLTALTLTNNEVTSLDLSGLPALELVFCGNNQLSVLDVSTNSNLTTLDCRLNQLSELDLSANTMLIKLNCFSNLLTELNVQNGNNLNMPGSDFNTNNNPDLTCIQVDDAVWSEANWNNTDPTATFTEDCEAFNACIVTIPDAAFKAYLVGESAINTNGDTEIQCEEAVAYVGSIYCIGMGITDLTGIEAFINVFDMNCSDNQITTIDLSGNIGMRFFECDNTPLTTINLNGCSNLEILTLYNNTGLTQLDVSTNLNLENLNCSNSPIEILDVSMLDELSILYCEGSALTTLDISSNPELYRLKCGENQLTWLNLQNGNNSNFQTFNATENPHLYCILVDDPSWSTDNWSANVDEIASFSNDCICTMTNAVVEEVTVCDPEDNTYETTITVEYEDAPGGNLNVNGQLFAATGSPQTITLTGLNANGETVDLTVDFEEDASCMYSIQTAWTAPENCSSSTGMENNTEDQFLMYPNPVKDQLFIELVGTTTIQIYSVHGEVVLDQTGISGTSVVDVNGFAPGVYLIRMGSGVTHKFIKE
ncbi:hypothetical protein GCM10009118_33020 [Wandonia haliotis]|uniref:Secretion system C-terminal sorting domain-containing protein n=1 Tax=Wandonia haliotis TaxID=574963 RepID=A0ABN1MU78_9FLAO